MPQLRKDPVVGRWVIISTDRAKRPTPREHKRNSPRNGPCPFCEGNEGLTPPEIMAYRAAGSSRESPGWTLRVVPNKFPALMIEGELDRRGEGVYDLMNGVGAHEVVVETPNHETNMGALSEKQYEEILWAYRDRILDLRKDKRFRYVLIFKNQGSEAYRPADRSTHCHRRACWRARILQIQGTLYLLRYRAAGNRRTSPSGK
ncbi:MAG: hypothetical protein E6J89_05270 [Deltaproteobacteria bacterium]|nr:MAG: hypothetical protein E6J89_05270 [Deltaproteobacteria bacterium]